MGGAYVQAMNGIAVGVDGVTCTHLGLTGNTLRIRVSSQLAAHRVPWSTPFRTTLRVEGLDTRSAVAVRINDLSPMEWRTHTDGLIPLVVQTNGRFALER